MGDKTKKDSELDEALEGTFPASDPVKISEGDGEADRPADRRPAAIDHDLVERLAEEVRQKQADLKRGA